MDDLKLNWRKFHAFDRGNFTPCQEARAGLYALHAYSDGRWAVGMYRGWRARVEGRAAPDLVEAMRAAEEFLLAELANPLEESPHVAAWRQAREAGIAAGWATSPTRGLQAENGPVKCTGFVDEDEDEYEFAYEYAKDEP